MKTTGNSPRETPLHERVAARAGRLSASERKVAEFMADHPEVVVSCSANELGARTGTSDATVIRTTKALGYQGLRELKHSLLEVYTRQRDLAATMGDRLERLSADGDQLAIVLNDTIGLLTQMHRSLDIEAWQRAVAAVLSASGVLVQGIGPAGSVADYLSLSLRRIGVRARSSCLTGFRLADELLSLRAGEVVIIFAPLREFRETSLVIDHAGQVGAPVIVVTESLGMALEQRVHAVLSTPQSTTSGASEITAGFVLAHALTVSVAAASRQDAVTTLQLVNTLRAGVVGTELDVAPLPTAE